MLFLNKEIMENVPHLFSQGESAGQINVEEHSTEDWGGLAYYLMVL